MEQTNTETQTLTPRPPKPDNNMAIAILCTICCCLPLGIVAVIKASNVNSLYVMGQYEAAELAAVEAKKWSIIGIVIGFVLEFGYIFIYSSAFASLLLH